ncbi:hypothetical protein FOCC_FOCC007424 [Frankliniella occidentalis]|nr:hypothetical protein FOCC_FOCC007424 [Frankliniella occidentalis]
MEVNNRSVLTFLCVCFCSIQLGKANPSQTNMSSVFITGSNRGIGLEMVKQLLAHANPPSTLFATCRNPDSATELQALAKNHSNLIILKLGTYY